MNVVSKVSYIWDITSPGYLNNDRPWSSAQHNEASIYGSFGPVSESCRYKHTYISNPSFLLSTTIYLQSRPSHFITMSIDLSKLSAEDVAAATAAAEAARRAHEEREHLEVEK
jgi:hypothetical protein